jgi:hypothetical protein
LRDKGIITLQIESEDTDTANERFNEELDAFRAGT